MDDRIEALVKDFCSAKARTMTNFQKHISLISLWSNNLNLCETYFFTSEIGFSTYMESYVAVMPLPYRNIQRRI